MTADRSTAGRSEPTILIVDDTPTNIELMNAILEDDYSVLFALSGEEALERVVSAPVPAAALDLILLDVVMPGIGGYETLRRLRADPRSRDIPVIFITGKDGADHEAEGLSLGAVDYVSKPISAAILRARVRTHVRLKRTLEAMFTLARTDELTGLANRRHLEEHLRETWSVAAGAGEPMASLMVDIDSFKRLNDALGYPAGDMVLRQVAGALESACRSHRDLAGRYGGGRFALILPGTTAEAAERAAESIHAALEALAPNCPQTLDHRETAAGRLTASIGVATVEATIGGDPGQLLVQAERALHKAREQGRNRTVTAARAGEP
jgi:diguanylate cyclase (GGDEF)-like protein